MLKLFVFISLFMYPFGTFCTCSNMYSIICGRSAISIDNFKSLWCYKFSTKLYWHSSKCIQEEAMKDNLTVIFSSHSNCARPPNDSVIVPSARPITRPVTRPVTEPTARPRPSRTTRPSPITTSSPTLRPKPTTRLDPATRPRPNPTTRPRPSLITRPRPTPRPRPSPTATPSPTTRPRLLPSPTPRPTLKPRPRPTTRLRPDQDLPQDSDPDLHIHPLLPPAPHTDQPLNRPSLHAKPRQRRMYSLSEVNEKICLRSELHSTFVSLCTGNSPNSKFLDSLGAFLERTDFGLYFNIAITIWTVFVFARSCATSSNLRIFVMLSQIVHTSACVCKSLIMAYCDRDDNPADLRFEWCTTTATQLYLASAYSCDFELLATVPAITQVYILGSAPCKCFCNLNNIYTNCTSCISNNHSPNNSAEIAAPITLAIIIVIIALIIVYCKCLKKRGQGDNKKPFLPVDDRNVQPIPPRPGTQDRNAPPIPPRPGTQMEGRMEGREEGRETAIKTEIETVESSQLIHYSAVQGPHPNGLNPNGPNPPCPTLQGPYLPGPSAVAAQSSIDLIDLNTDNVLCLNIDKLQNTLNKISTVDGLKKYVGKIATDRKPDLINKTIKKLAK